MTNAKTKLFSIFGLVCSFHYIELELYADTYAHANVCTSGVRDCMLVQLYPKDINA